MVTGVIRTNFSSKVRKWCGSRVSPTGYLRSRGKHKIVRGPVAQENGGTLTVTVILSPVFYSFSILTGRARD